MQAIRQSEESTTPITMAAIVQPKYGTADVLSYSQTAVPDIEDDQVLIEVHAAGLDRGVWHLMTGLPYVVRLAGYGITRPKQPIPGFDVAGRVVAVGDAVTFFDVGDEVFGIATGAFAEYAVASESKLVHKPETVSFASASVAAISGITALQAVTDIADVRPGQKVLVIGASGGVGSFAVQIARSLGAVVTGVGRGSKADVLKSLGAHHVIDYTATDYLDGSQLYDVIIDTGGLNRLRDLRRALTADGTLVIVGGENGGKWTGGVGRQLRAMVVSMFSGQRLTSFISKEQRSSIQRLGELMSEGSVVPVIGRRYRLEEAPAAIADLVAGRASGKSAIIVRSEVDGVD